MPPQEEQDIRLTTEEDDDDDDEGCDSTGGDTISGTTGGLGGIE